MKTIFIHDHPFFYFNGVIYSGGNFPYSVWKRYLDVFDELVVVGRGRVIERFSGLSLSSHERVTFRLFYNVRGGVDYFLKKKQIKRSLRKLIKDADLVIVRLPSNIAALAVEVSSELGKPYAVELVGCVWDANVNHNSIIAKLRAPFSFVRVRRAVKNAIGVIYVTESFLQRRYPARSKIVSYASNVCIDDFSDDILSNHQKILMREKTEYRLGLLANLQVKYKGFEVLFRALDIARDKLDRPVELRLYGGGDSRYIDSLINKYNLQGNVKIMGSLRSGEEVFYELDKLDLYVQPSLTEGLPRAVIEAMSRGCPVLASSAGGVPELLPKEYLHQPGDYEVLAEHLIRYLQCKESLLRMSEHNFIKAKEYIDPILSERRTSFWHKVKMALPHD